ncbi:hypothetical protein KC722_03380 [Candidatus Kaiserbacteria bacterium]|nr:hypothetical protein [Candidatus Kaiserbacteria bacterium]MCB9811430.1 hypothetical protein [Candidatus Nomurabacteria bacterium]
MKFCITILLCFLITSVAYGASDNAGFVEGLWFSNEVIIVGEPVRIYVAVRNNTGSDLSGTVEFFVNDKPISKNEVGALTGRIIETWADWTPTAGTSTVRAVLSGTQLEPVGSSSQPITLSLTESTRTIFADIDTDNDGIPNQTDTDDDGDGVSDSDELENGTDPLTYDEPETATAANEDENEVAKTNTLTQNTSGGDRPEGLEQYLSDNRAHSAFAGVTEVINTTKKQLDEYRSERSAALEQTNTENDVGEQTTATNTLASEGFGAGGFGTITRSTTSDAGENSFFAGLLSLISHLFHTLVTFILFVISTILGHPALVQVGLLLLILFTTYRLAKKFGSRKQ